MRTLVKRTLVAAAAVGAALAFSSAQAYVMSGSMLNMTNFVIKDSNGNVLDYNSSFLVVNGTPSVTFTGTADQSVALTGFATINNTDTNPPTNPIDFAPICLGAGCNPILPNNSLPKLLAPPVTGNYSAADQYETGAPIANVPGFAAAAGADVGQGTYVGLDTGSVTGSATANNNLNSSFIFALNQTTGITFEFTLDAFLQVAVSSDELFPGFATSALSMDFTITDLSSGLTVFSYSPDVFGDGVKTLSLNAPLPINIQLVKDNTDDFSATTAALTAGTLYQASFRMTTEADAGRLQAVPEPATLALVGMGLLGVAALRRRRT